MIKEDKIIMLNVVLELVTFASKVLHHILPCIIAHYNHNLKLLQILITIIELISTFSPE